MNKNIINASLITLLLASSNATVAGSNNGYTTAVNVYSGSSSLGWYGGGVKYWLAEWKQEKMTSAAEAEAVSEEMATASVEMEEPAAESDEAMMEVEDAVSMPDVAAEAMETMDEESTAH